MDVSDALIFAVVVLARLGIPLAIFRYPLPSIVATMILDAADQTIFQQFTDLNLENYQSYDKALDVYYLGIAYISTLRNWTNLFAFEASRFLWYYRLVGVTAFELSGWRPLLLIFPNTFEYFFDWYEAIRTRWNPLRLTRYFILGSAAAIWIFIKLPQEFWIHVAQLDTTDVIKEDILGVSVDTPWGEALSENLWVLPVLFVVGIGLWFAYRRLSQRLPQADWKTTFDVDVHLDRQEPAGMSAASERETPRLSRQALWAIRHILAEKIVLIGLTTVIFSQLIPDLDASVLQIIIGVGFVIVANSVVSIWLAQRGTHWESILTEFGVMAAINLAIVAVYRLILPETDGEVRFLPLLFFILLLTLLVTLFDRYRPIYERRVQAVRRTGEVTTQ